MADYPSSPYTNIDIRMISLFEIERWEAKGILNLYPSYGRGFCWDERRMSELIETIIHGYPIPSIVINELDTRTYEVVDGTQRLVTIISFLRGEFCLKSEDCLLNHRYFKDLDSVIRRKIEDYRLIACFIHPESPKDVSEIFMVMNGRGVALSPQELRHAKFVQQGITVVGELSREPGFVRQIKGKGINADSYQAEELVLRFLAFYLQGYEQYQGDMRKFLDKTLEEYKRYEDREYEFKIKFREVFEAVGHIWGDDAFCLPKGYRTGRNLCRELYDVITYSFTRYSPDQLILRKEAIRDCLNQILKVPEFQEAVTGRGKRKVSENMLRFTMWLDALERVMEEINV